MYNMLRRMREERAEGDRGFTLIELLVVVVIIGILVAIAIPIYLHYENGAKNKSAESDARNAATAIEQCKADNNGVLPDIAFSDQTTNKDLTCNDQPETIVVTDGNSMTVTQADDGSYTVAVTSGADKTYTYYSSTGSFTAPTS